MVLRKPYAFLIKHFRLIHFVLFGLILYITVATKPVIDMYGQLADQGTLDGYNSLGIIVYLAIIISIAFGFAMLLLMINKSKPKRFYLYLMLYYFVFLMALFASNGIISELSENKIISIQTARAYFDISRMIYWPQIIFVIFSLVRAVGFDIKRFGFEKDLNDLNLNEQDREEFEVSIKFDYHLLLSKIRHYIRELRYYFLENTTIIISIIIISVLGLALAIFINSQVKNKIYSESDVFTANNFQFTINSSYLTNTNQKGEKFSNNLYYLIIDLNIKNIKDKGYKLQLTDFTIRNNNKNILVTSYKNNNFVDLGAVYKNELIRAGETINKIAVFEVKNYNYNDSKYTLKILDYFKNNNQNGSEEPVFTVVDLSPIILDSLEIQPRKYYGLTTKLDQTLLKNSSVIIKDYNIRDMFVYDYEKCITKDNCRPLSGTIQADDANTLLVLDYNLIIDETSFYQKNTNGILDFFDDFATIRYTSNNQSIITTAKVMNPSRYEGKVILQTTALIKKAHTMDLYITIRNQRYVISLK